MTVQLLSTPEGGLRYIHRGLMNYLKLLGAGSSRQCWGHEIGPRRGANNILRAGDAPPALFDGPVVAVAAAIASGSLSHPPANGEHRATSWLFQDTGFAKNEMEAESWSEYASRPAIAPRPMTATVQRIVKGRSV